MSDVRRDRAAPLLPLAAPPNRLQGWTHMGCSRPCSCMMSDSRQGFDVYLTNMM